MKKTSKEQETLVNESSEAHRITFNKGINFDKINDASSSIYAYGHSKLANILHANELIRQLKEEKGNLTNSLHPGAIATIILRHHNFLKVLPIMIDVGTNNEALLKHPLYDDNSSTCLDLGLQQHRLDGEEYIVVIDEFMEVVFTRWPHVIVQFEYFQSKWAFKLRFASARDIFKELQNLYAPDQISIGLPITEDMLEDVSGSTKHLIKLLDATMEGSWWKAKAILKDHKDAPTKAISNNGAMQKGLLRVMGVQGLTIYHVKSHSQKYSLAKYLLGCKQ